MRTSVSIGLYTFTTADCWRTNVSAPNLDFVGIKWQMQLCPTLNKKNLDSEMDPNIMSTLELIWSIVVIIFICILYVSVVINQK